MENNFKVINKRTIGFKNEFRWNLEKFYSGSTNLIVNTMNEFDDLFDGRLIEKYNTKPQFRGKSLEELNTEAAIQCINGIMLDIFFNENMVKVINKYASDVKCQYWDRLLLQQESNVYELSVIDAVEMSIRVSTAIRLFIPRISNITDDISKPSYIKFTHNARAVIFTKIFDIFANDDSYKLLYNYVIDMMGIRPGGWLMPISHERLLTINRVLKVVIFRLFSLKISENICKDLIYIIGNSIATVIFNNTKKSAKLSNWAE